jgi:hypothetical protein
LNLNCAINHELYISLMVLFNFLLCFAPMLSVDCLCIFQRASLIACWTFSKLVGLDRSGLGTLLHVPQFGKYLVGLQALGVCFSLQLSCHPHLLHNRKGQKPKLEEILKEETSSRED